MKASELITLLQDAIDKYGDLPLTNDFYDRFELVVCDAEGVEIDENNQAQASEIYVLIDP